VRWRGWWTKPEEAHERFWLLHKGNTDERTHRNNTPTTTSLSHRHTRALNNFRKMKRFVKCIRHLKRSDKKSKMKMNTVEQNHFKQNIKGPDKMVNLVGVNTLRFCVFNA